MTFNPQRAEALRTAIFQTLDWLRTKPPSDISTLLTEHLALLQEAELIFLTDAFVGEDEETGESYSELLKKTYEPIFQAYIDPRKDEPTKPQPSLYESLWRTMCTDMGEAFDVVQQNPEFFGARCGDDKLKIIGAFFIKWASEKLKPDQPPKPWVPDDSGEWVEVPDDCMTCPVPSDTRVQMLQHGERRRQKFVALPATAGSWVWDFGPGCEDRIVAYKVIR